MSIASSHTRRSVLKLLGTAAAGAPFITRDLRAAPPSGRLRHAGIGVAGQGASDLDQIANCDGVDIVALCDVDLQRAAAARKKFPKATFYQDWRELLAKEELDSIHIGIPDHMHAPVAVTAMRQGLHVYGQKPLAHNLAETRFLAELAAEQNLVTQMGIQIHSTAYYQIAARTMRDEVVGKIEEIHIWSGKTWGDPTPRPDRRATAPAHLDWDGWLGVAADRPYIDQDYYHPGNWRKRLDFGTGTLGDMGCHIFDPLFMGLGLATPISVRSEGPAPNATNWAINGKVRYTFAKTPHTAGETLPVTWYDGSSKPPQDVLDRIDDGEVPEQGSMLIGTDGVLLVPHVALPKLFPSEKFASFRLPRERGTNHWGQFVEACRGQGKTTAHFGYAGPLTEAILLGCLASHFPQTTLTWDPATMKFDKPEADALVGRSYRDGWGVPGLG